MFLDLTSDKPTLAQIMSCCRQARSHYLHQCYRRYMSTNGINRPQRFNVINSFFTLSGEITQAMGIERYITHSINDFLIWTWLMSTDTTMLNQTLLVPTEDDAGNYIHQPIKLILYYIISVCLYGQPCCSNVKAVSLVISFVLNHWGRVTHVCVGKLTIIDSDNGLSPEQRKTIIWTNAGILSIGPWEQTSVKF